MMMPPTPAGAWSLEEQEAILTAKALAAEVVVSPPLPSSEESATSQAGAQAFTAGETVNADPHPRSSAESGLWRSGWMGAARA